MNGLVIILRDEHGKTWYKSLTMLQLLEPVLYLYTSLVYMIYLTKINALRAVIFALVNELLYMYRTCKIQKSYMYVVLWLTVLFIEKSGISCRIS